MTSETLQRSDYLEVHGFLFRHIPDKPRATAYVRPLPLVGKPEERIENQLRRMLNILAYAQHRGGNARIPDGS
jgi:hypothetical protein